MIKSLIDTVLQGYKMYVPEVAKCAQLATRVGCNTFSLEEIFKDYYQNSLVSRAFQTPLKTRIKFKHFSRSSRSFCLFLSSYTATPLCKNYWPELHEP